MLRWRTHDGASNHNTSPAYGCTCSHTPDNTYTLTVSQRSGQPGPDTQKHHQLYRDRAARLHQHTVQHTVVTKTVTPIPSSNYHPRTVTHGGRGRARGAPPGWGRFFKSSHQGSILAWLNARTGHTSKAI
ncbi:hypothetical protein K0M31_013935 [Melipona bicolor]|uniref:Uncharacterized protein n=1 Tax=Melipona bicolor TaxID=60889 RepID=A0AA40G7K9_9HYME|nr:hypothetical protein K0M31_013935 [Melipona bicolor]